MDAPRDYTDGQDYSKGITEGMPPVIISVASTGGNQKSGNPNVPVTGEEQADDAADTFAAGARIFHIHARQADDPTLYSNEAARYREINDLIRSKAPEVLVDNTQTIAKLLTEGDLAADVYYFKSAPADSGPDVMSLNPGPMTFRGSGEDLSMVIAGSFDDTERAANLMRERGIKPQVFLYHPGHLDILEYLIEHDALDKPYFVQLVFGQQSGIRTSPDSVLYMVQNLPSDSIFQTCAIGLEAIQVNTLSLLLGGHVRTGMEDSILYQRDEPSSGNVQLVERIVRIANDLGRKVATVEETRSMLGISK